MSFQWRCIFVVFLLLATGSTKLNCDRRRRHSFSKSFENRGKCDDCKGHKKEHLTAVQRKFRGVVVQCGGFNALFCTLPCVPLRFISRSR